MGKEVRLMSPSEYIEFCDAVRSEFFEKYPIPSKTGARAFWKQSLQHARNALEDRDYDPDTFQKSARKIWSYLTT